jgi:flagellar biosynthetic protein FliQ
LVHSCKVFTSRQRQLTPETVLTLTQQALQMTVLVSAPMLGAALVTGLLVSLFQAATQINEMTLSFIPKLLVLILVLVLAGPWMLNMMLDYMRRLFLGIPGMIG